MKLITDGDKAFASLMYLAGFSTFEISNEVECAQGTIIRIIRKSGIPKLSKPINKVGKRCLSCNKIYYTNKYKVDTSKYCSKKCKSNYKNKGQVAIECKTCKKIFYRDVAQHEYRTKKVGQKREFCSIQCYRERSPLVECHCKCGATFRVHQSRLDYYHNVYCSQKCYFQYGTHGTIINLPSDRLIYNKFVARLRRKANYLRWKKKCLTRDLFECKVCNKKKGITVHHKIPVAAFIIKHGLNKNAVENDPKWTDTSNGITLCRSCHRKEHNRKEDD